jgi:predicted HicB family RNase H-like nuclease
MLKPDNNKPFPLRLGELKPILQAQAAEQDRSLHNWIKKILKTHVEKSKKTKQTA